MLLGNFQSLYAYKLDNTHFELIGVIDDLISVDWKKYFAKYGEATIKLTPTKNNIALLKKGVVLSPSSKNAIIVDTVEIVIDNGQIALQVKGLTLEKILSRRIIAETFIANNLDAPEMLTQLMMGNLGVLAGTKRYFPYFEISEDVPNIGPTNFERQISDNLYDIATEYCEVTPTMGYEVQFIPAEQKLFFQIFEGADHSDESNSPVIFSNNLENLISLDYYTSNRDFKNLAYVFGEASESGRVIELVGDANLQGYERFEHYVDARDLQSEDGETTIPMSDYRRMLDKRGKEKLAELQEVETVAGKLDVNNSTFKYGVDYTIGDKVTVMDQDIGIKVNAQIIGVQEKYSTTQTSELIVGYELPTVSEKIKTLYK